MSSTLLRKLATVSAAFGAVALATGIANAQSQFGAFNISGGAPYTYSNASGVFSATTTGFFTFSNLPALNGATPYTSGVPVAATMTLTAQTLGNTLGTTGSNVDDISVYNVSLLITDSSGGAGNGSTLLRITPAGGTISQGELAFDQTTPNAGQLNGDTTAGDTFQFSSDYLTFSAAPSAIRVYSLTMSDIDPPGSPGSSAGYSRGANNRPEDFVSGGGFVFSANPSPVVVPEAGTAGLLLGALPLLGGLAIVARRKK